MSLDQLPETPVIEEQRPYVPERRRVVPVYVRVIGIVLAATFGLSTLGLILLGAVSVLSVSVSDSTSQSIAVTNPASLVVQSDVVDLHISASNTNQITVKTTRRASALTHGLAQRALDQMSTDVSSSDDTVTITTSLPDFNTGLGVNQIDMRVDVTVPQHTNLDITSDVGNVDVRGVTGVMTISSNAGNETLSNVTLSGSSALRNDAGNITCSCKLDAAATALFSTVAGNINLTLPRATSASLTATAGTGNVTVDQAWPLSVTHKDAGAVANGDLVPSPTGSITAQTTVGNITVLSR